MIDSAKLIKIHNSPQQFLYLRKLKVPRVHYGRKIANNTYAYVIAPNGLWYNFVFETFEHSAKRANIEITDKNTAMAYEAMRQSFENEFGKKDFWEKYGGIIIYGIFIIITGLILWFMFGRMLQITDKIRTLIDSLNVLTEQTKNLIESAGRIEKLALVK